MTFAGKEKRGYFHPRVPLLWCWLGRKNVYIFPFNWERSSESFLPETNLYWIPSCNQIAWNFLVICLRNRLCPWLLRLCVGSAWQFPCPLHIPNKVHLWASQKIKIEGHSGTIWRRKMRGVMGTFEVFCGSFNCPMTALCSKLGEKASVPGSKGDLWIIVWTHKIPSTIHI